jgi:predicted 3-demethylubiquinone-9 3-methyltransferase (glyoxalase superfamily)
MSMYIQEEETAMEKVVPSLWFDNQAEEAVDYYASVFKEVTVKNVSRFGGVGPGEKGKVMTMSFSLNGQDFFAINGGPHYSFTPAVSFSINCETQADIDHYWNHLSDGGEPGLCGWLVDKFGVSWQVVPTILGELLRDPDPEKAQRVSKAMLGMKKLDIEQLQQS